MMQHTISSDESHSSDDEYYDNFTKYKAKLLKKEEPAAVQNCSNERNSKCDADESLKLVDGVACEAQENLQSDHPIDAIHTNLDAEASFIDLSVRDSAPSPAKFSEATNNICTINISSRGQTRVFCCERDEPIQHIIEDYAERANVDPGRVILYTKQYKRCDPKETPRILGCTDDSLIELDAFEDLEANEVKVIKLKFQLKGRRTIRSDVLPDSDFASLKRIFCTENDLDLAKTQFIFDSDRITDSDTPNSLGLEDDDCIDVYLIG